MIRHQFIRNILSLRFLLIGVVSFVLMFVQYWTAHHAGFILTKGAPTFLRDVMLFSPDGAGTGLYLFLLPFLAALLGGSVIAVERHSGRMKELLAREGRGRIMRTSMASGFILGGIGGVMPLLLNLMVAAALNPHMSFIDGSSVLDKEPMLPPFVLIDATSWAYPLYQRSQLLLILVIVLMVFVISGFFADIAVGSSFFTTHKYVELLIPFVASVLWWMLPALTDSKVPDQWSHNIFLSFYAGGEPYYRMQNYVGMVLAVLLPSIACIVMMIVERRRDAL
ncbi:MAG: ABC transporter permease [Bifidobacterium subtile]|jgi:hypothetical protein|nr:ABC transporter permease [Bifidobacterium subtile]